LANYGKMVKLEVEKLRHVARARMVMAHRLTQEQVIGSMLGMAIGDALGMPFRGRTADEIQQSYGRVESFQSLVFPDGAELKAGEFSGASETVLCIIESFTTNNGEFDEENILARFEMLTRGESKRWLDPTILIALEALDKDLGENAPILLATGDVAARGIPVGLVHAYSNQSIETLIADSSHLANMTHPDPLAAEAVAVVAASVQIAGNRSIESLAELPEALTRFLPDSSIARRIAADELRLRDGSAEISIGSLFDPSEAASGVVHAAVLIASQASDPISPLIESVNLGGATSSRSAITGAIVGAFFGAGSIPQEWIDASEGRVYLLLAAPWFFRTMQFKYSSVKLHNGAQSGTL
jgi:ADP-ribosylglycohydrolase